MFRIVGLPLAPFAPLFALPDQALADRGARRVPVARAGVAPCRVSLADARPGQSVILLNYPHLDDPASPFRASGPIYVSESARDRAPDVDHVPPMLATRLLSARVYDASNMMIDADVMEGETLAGRLADWLADPEVRHVHLHAARRGCYLAMAERD
ncbi:DUF1203 domain-containing protein [Brevundimonas sp.]|uniref:DUF1203 domain-containing protein n=1 Tax=Brevundimonas sp. TaxID=1871086 RepID=UPI001E04ECA4|nr:DUF1203 domain-containing protein [Brevundimonas sp.]MBA3999594.1 DUF1203 domain-containing protein [Brevundimonas sp.]